MSNSAWESLYHLMVSAVEFVESLRWGILVASLVLTVGWLLLWAFKVLLRSKSHSSGSNFAETDSSFFASRFDQMACVAISRRPRRRKRRHRSHKRES